MKAVLLKAELRRNNQVTIPKVVTEIIGIPRDTTLSLALLGFFDEQGAFHNIKDEKKLGSCDRCVVIDLGNIKHKEVEEENVFE